ncbi:peptidoglycan D,D-transpeptidase FtsI family protein [Ereboglobus luteus]|uniref:Peptidoglycan glycosyltransferase n=1 Tax=Ereboglobus luteus TaxID=1796921 RepID=A0A2U8E2E5_9BACT|nr:penicillin-binding transpeptidase domain-containing protein [Ereboglobus luteus]AWI08965.1 peptidoglycan glycosyltransferase [Ereboglobus luteus]
MQPPDKTDPRSGTLVEIHKTYDKRIVIFYPTIGILLLIVAIGFAYQQLFKTNEYAESEKIQSLRRILTPGPRGNIYDREGRLLVGNLARYAVTINLDELRAEFRRAYLITRRNYREADDKNIPSSRQLWIIARYAVMQRYLDRINEITGRDEAVNATRFQRHFNQQLLIPYTLIDDLTPGEYARLAEQLPVNSPLRLTASSIRYYPHGSAAAHVLGYIRSSDDLDAEGFPGENLTTFKMRGTTGRDGLELRFNEHLQGKPGYTIYRVDPAGYRIEPPLEHQRAVQGQSIVTSLDIDLQKVAETQLGDIDNDGYRGAVVALDVPTGEVLALASNPGYNPNDFFPRLSQETVDKMNTQRAWFNLAIAGGYQPGSTFKIIDAIAGFRHNVLKPDTEYYCDGILRVGNRNFVCNNHSMRGEMSFRDAIAKSCNIFFYRESLVLGAQPIADEARRFGLDQRTGIELPSEGKGNIPDPIQRRARGLPWTGGDTVTLAIGQSEITVTPLEMAGFAASVARNETRTTPTILHDPNRTRQRTEPIGLTPEQRHALVDAMRETMKTGSGRMLTNPRFKALNLGYLDIAGKTGTAQREVWVDGKRGIINLAWFIGFAPAENPSIAIAVVLEGNIPGEELGGGAKAAPIAGYVLKKYFEKHPDQIPAQPEM